MANTTEQYQRASTFSKGIGASLESIQNRDVLLRGYEISERPMRGESTTFVAIQVSEVGDEEVQDFHAWSDSLAEKLKEVPLDALPLLIKFTRVQTGGGYRVWTFE